MSAGIPIVTMMRAVFPIRHFFTTAPDGPYTKAKFGRNTAIEFVTAYAIEKSLSLDNLFLFIVIFGRLVAARQLLRGH